MCGCMGVFVYVRACGCMCVDSSEDRLMSLLSTITAVSGVCMCKGVWVYGCVGVGMCVWVDVCVWVCMGVCV